MAKFSSVPGVPLSGLTTQQYSLLGALKENVELLTGARSSGRELRAVTKAQLQVAPASAQTMSQITAEGAGFTISGVNVPSLDDYVKLLSNVQQLANDVASLRGTVNALIGQLKA